MRAGTHRPFHVTEREGDSTRWHFWILLGLCRLAPRLPNAVTGSRAELGCGGSEEGVGGASVSGGPLKGSGLWSVIFQNTRVPVLPSPHGTLPTTQAQQRLVPGLTNA